jgi:NAD-dependent SIR2 family protein deacetylase
MYAKAPSRDELAQLTALFARGPVAVLTGAGVSTESGIPDYRGPETRRRARNPMQYREFLHDALARRRYWARSMLGWPRMRAALPNAAHRALAVLERAGRLSGVVTQNVDGLHVSAGSRALVELHGALRHTLCLACGTLHEREQVQRALERLNPAFSRRAAQLLPDGDAELPAERLAEFQLHECECGGVLKPHVVFFGENVPAQRVARAMALVEQAAALLVVGTSLAVYSGLRFVRAAAARGLPVGIVGLGETRGDALASLRVEAGAGATLSALCAALIGPEGI